MLRAALAMFVCGCRTVLTTEELALNGGNVRCACLAPGSGHQRLESRIKDEWRDGITSEPRAARQTDLRQQEAPGLRPLRSICCRSWSTAHVERGCFLRNSAPERETELIMHERGISASLISRDPGRQGSRSSPASGGWPPHSRTSRAGSNVLRIELKAPSPFAMCS